MQDGKDKNTETKKYKEQEEPNKSAKKADGEKVSEGVKASESLKTEKYDAATGKTDGAKKARLKRGAIIPIVLKRRQAPSRLREKRKIPAQEARLRKIKPARMKKARAALR